LFAGLAVLLNQSVVSKGLQASAGLGNMNATLYSLAQNTPAAFHDVTTGNNIINVQCGARQPKCTPGPAGFSAGTGYDQVTGLGSVDAGALFNAWVTNGAHNTPPASPVITAVGNAASYNSTYAPGMILTIYGTQLAPQTVPASSVPLPL